MSANGNSVKFDGKSRTRSKRGKFSIVPVLEVTQVNIGVLWPQILMTLHSPSTSHVAIDLELSGLGDRRLLNGRSIEDRYLGLKHAAETRSVLSIGLAIFQLRSRNLTKKRLRIKCTTYNILCSRQGESVIESDALRFLSEHTFDFNAQIRHGIPYYSAGGDPNTLAQANNTGASASKAKNCPLKCLLEELLISGKPLVMHNSLVDLAFLYQQFYAQLPDDLETFRCDLTDWFEAPSTSEQNGSSEEDRVVDTVVANDMRGLYDTKYEVDYELHWSASFLAYVFRKCQRENANESSLCRVYVAVELEAFDYLPPSQRSDWIDDTVDCSLPPTTATAPLADTTPICPHFASHGFCAKKKRCDKSHNLDVILAYEGRKRDRRKRKHTDSITDGVPCNGVAKESSDHPVTDPISNCQSGTLALNSSHRAGVDAFMTGYAMAYLSRLSLLREGVLSPRAKNKVPLSGKPFPLLIERGAHVSCSERHRQKWADLVFKMKK